MQSGKWEGKKIHSAAQGWGPFSWRNKEKDVIEQHVGFAQEKQGPNTIDRGIMRDCFYICGAEILSFWKFAPFIGVDLWGKVRRPRSGQRTAWYGNPLGHNGEKVLAGVHLEESVVHFQR